ncbi:hypothetical protein K502DRAFT_339516 [Neoconidiobolus thromboides FSU 785]|nr:hypothetical protein K502DRAFT_339516 [Neoconidiobolus thromboides FSU 785]
MDPSKIMNHNNQTMTTSEAMSQGYYYPSNYLVDNDMSSHMMMNNFNYNLQHYNAYQEEVYSSVPQPSFSQSPVQLDHSDPNPLWIPPAQMVPISAYMSQGNESNDLMISPEMEDMTLDYQQKLENYNSKYQHNKYAKEGGWNMELESKSIIQMQESIRERAENWSPIETQHFVSAILKYKKEMKEMRKHPEVWEKLSLEMKRQGYERSLSRCKNKWKSLVAKFKKLSKDILDSPDISTKAQLALDSEPFLSLNEILQHSYQQTDSGLVKKYKSGFVKALHKEQTLSFQFHPENSGIDDDKLPTFTQFQL